MAPSLSNGILSISPLFDLQPLIDFALSESLPLDQSQLSQISSFCERLYEVNQSRNLTRVPPEECISRHIIDSLLVQSLIPQGSSVLDIGTGPGFPSWPLALARPDLRITAVDSSGKMISFLQSNPLPNLVAIQTRVEDSGISGAFDVVTGRALAPLAIQLELSAPNCKLGGIIVPFRTDSESLTLAEDSQKILGLELDRIEYREMPGLTNRRAFPIYRKVKQIPGKFLRTWAQMKAKPLK